MLVLISDGDQRASYQFSVSGDAAAGAVADLTNAEIPDSVASDTVSGAVAEGGVDNFFFSGTVTAFSYDGPLRVLRDGKEVDPDSLSDNTGGDGDEGSNGRQLQKR